MANCHNCERLVICPWASPEEIICSSFKPKPQTNADRIRAMTDEELAEFAVSTGQGCAPDKNFVECCFDHKDGLIEADCRKCWLDWLKEEVVSDG